MCVINQNFCESILRLSIRSGVCLLLVLTFFTFILNKPGAILWLSLCLSGDLRKPGILPQMLARTHFITSCWCNSVRLMPDKQFSVPLSNYCKWWIWPDFCSLSMALINTLNCLNLIYSLSCDQDRMLYQDGLVWLKQGGLCVVWRIPAAAAGWGSVAFKQQSISLEIYTEAWHRKSPLWALLLLFTQRNLFLCHPLNAIVFRTDL